MLPEIQPTEFVITPPPAPPTREPFWGYVDLAVVIGLLAAAIGLILVAAGILLYARPHLKTDAAFLLTTQLALYVFVYVCFFITFKTRYDRPVFSSLGWQKSSFSPLRATACGVALAFALSAIGSLIHIPKVKSPLDDLTATPLTLALFGIMAVTLAPLFEELVFRGFVQPLLSRSLGAVAGIGLTATVFGAMHSPEYQNAWQYVLFIALAGAAFGWVRLRSNSIIPAIVMHGAFNLVSVIGLAVSKYAPHSVTSI